MILITFAVILGGYFLPWLIALLRGHPRAIAIFVFNLLLGWTVIGWVGVLVWACVKPRKEQ